MKVKKEEIDPEKLDADRLMQTITSAIKDTTDPKELAYSKVATQLYSKENIAMVTRLTEEQIIQIIKSYIIIRFYQKYWTAKTINYEFKKIDVPPYYKMNTTYVDTIDEAEYNREFEELLTDIMTILISKKGLGREEGIAILSSAEKQITLKEKAMNMLEG